MDNFGHISTCIEMTKQCCMFPVEVCTCMIMVMTYMVLYTWLHIACIVIIVHATFIVALSNVCVSIVYIASHA